MFEGKRFLPDTGTPMRKIERISRLLALEEPVPLTFASFSAKSFTLLRVCSKCSAAMSGHHRNRGEERKGKQELEFLHVPRGGWATLGAQAAMHAEVLVLHHHAPRLGQCCGNIQRLVEVLRGSRQPRAQV